MHIAAVAFVEPATHAYPAAHKPEHSGSVKPVSFPNEPALQGPLQNAVDKPSLDPYKPAAQLVHTPAPGKLYVPTAHIDAVAFVDPDAHANPASQTPEHDDDVRPIASPYTPAGHGVHTLLSVTYMPTSHITDDIVGDGDGDVDALKVAVNVPVIVEDGDTDAVYDPEGDEVTELVDDADHVAVIVAVTDAEEVADGDSVTDRVTVTDGDTVTDDDSVTEGDSVTDCDSVAETDSVTDCVSVTEGDFVAVRDPVTVGDKVMVGDSDTDGDSVTEGVSVADGDAVADGDDDRV